MRRGADVASAAARCLAATRRRAAAEASVAASTSRAASERARADDDDRFFRVREKKSLRGGRRKRDASDDTFRRASTPWRAPPSPPPRAAATIATTTAARDALRPTGRTSIASPAADAVHSSSAKKASAPSSSASEGGTAAAASSSSASSSASSPPPHPPPHTSPPLITPDDVALASKRDTADVLRIFKVVRAIRNRGHFAARLDPLGRSLGPLREGYEAMETSVPEDGADIAALLDGIRNDTLFLRGRRVTPAQYLGLHDVDPDRKFYFGNELASLDPRGKGQRKQWWTLNEVLTRLQTIYCGTLTAEFHHIASARKKAWLQATLEGETEGKGHWVSARDRREVLRRLISADALERLLARSFPSAKRFGVEGAETLIPGLQAVVDAAATHGVESIVMGVAHRGRLNILNNVFRKPVGAICAEMRSEGTSSFNVGDVRYHLGTRTVVRVPERPDEEALTAADTMDGGGGGDGGGSGGGEMELSMAPNPSHLEAVNAVVTGMVRSKQMRRDARRGGRSRTAQGAVMGLIIHGDAAFCGLGANAEVMQLQDLPDYTTGGTVHIVVNNQIGFTTVPRRARSSPHPSDVAKGYGAPIFHVNGDDPEAVVRACRLAVAYRAEWRADVVVNLVCYRRYGHNEQDDPSITLPLRSKAIENHPRVVDVFARKLVAAGDIAEEEVERWRRETDEKFRAEHAGAAAHVEIPEDWVVSSWKRPVSHRDSALNGEVIDAESHSAAAAAEIARGGVDGVVVRDGPSGPVASSIDRAADSVGVTSDPVNPRARVTGVPLSLLRAVGGAITMLPDEDGKKKKKEKKEKKDAANAANADVTAAAADDDDESYHKNSLFPRDFEPHPHVRKLLSQRKAMVDEQTGVDWGTAELLAFGTLLTHDGEGEIENNGSSEGVTDTKGDPKPHCHVRLSGQDVERGTFNHRHSVLYCARSSRGHVPLNNLGLGPQDAFMVSNSPLSEHAILGFEYGFSVDAGPSALVLWEAQFGDFANNAQCVVDQFITTGEAKWGQRSGLVLLLPHGYDGQGPDHSNARPERWLAAANDDADTLPGRSPKDVEHARKTFEALAKGNDRISIDDLRARVERLEREAKDAMEESDSGGYGGNGGNGGNGGVTTGNGAGAGAADDTFEVFDEYGGMIRRAAAEYDETENEKAATDDAPSSTAVSAAETTTRTVVHGDTIRGEKAIAAKALTARAMYDDIVRFFGDDAESVDRERWNRYVRRRARSHADAATNFIVINASTPAQYFHALRRQALASHLKPMVVFTPKFLLHHRPCQSSLSDFGPGTRFHAVIGDGDDGDNTKNNASSDGVTKENHSTRDDRDVRRVVVCTGKMFYALQQARKRRGLEKEIALVRVEQLAPFPHGALASRLGKYPDAEIVWCQEEPKNMGWWPFVQPRINTAVRDLLSRDGDGDGGGGGGGGGSLGGGGGRTARYVGRPSTASPATGSQSIHALEMKSIVQEALRGVTEFPTKYAGPYGGGGGGG